MLEVYAPQMPEPIYVVGDIHGRLDLLDRLLELIEQDVARSGGPRGTLLFLGDYVDRGPASRGVLQRLIDLSEAPEWTVVTLRGNHDQYLLEFLRSPETGLAWARFGAAQTLQSYGVTSPAAKAEVDEWIEASTQMRKAVPASHVEFLKKCRLAASYGDYLFVHAGVKPGVAMVDQDPRDLLSIRQVFLDVDNPMPGQTVVYGHTPGEEPSIGAGKIGLDTGAYASGVLTAMRLKGGERSFIGTGGR